MSETKDLIKRLDAFIKNESYWIVPTGCTLFEEIKSFLEQQYQHEQNILNYGTDEPDRVIDGRDGIPYKIPEKKQQPQPDDELIEHLHWMELQKDVNGFTEIHVDTIREIRTILQSRPSVTREDVGELIETIETLGNPDDLDSWDRFAIPHIFHFLKSKGIEVKGEK